MTVELVLTNVGLAEQCPQRDDQPERRPAHGLHPRRASRRRAPQAVSQRELADRMREILTRALPGRGVPAVARRPRRQRLLERVHRRRSSSRCAATAWRSSTQSKAVAEVARAIPGIRDVYPSSSSTTPRSASRRIASRRRSSASARARPPRPPSRRRWEHQHPQRLDRRLERPVVLRRHLVRRPRRRRTPTPWRGFRCASATTAGRSRWAPTDTSGARWGPSPSSATIFSACARPDADGGARHRERRQRSGAPAAHRSSHARHDF